MTVILLREGMSTTCPTGALEIDWEIDGQPATEVSVVIEAPDTPGQAIPGVQSIGERRLLLTRLPEAVGLVARPRPGVLTFADAVTLQAQISVRTAGEDGDQIVLSPLDVSGTTSSTLLLITEAPGGWEITAARSGRSASTPVRPAPTAGAPAGAHSPAGSPADPIANDVPAVQRAAYAARRRAQTSSLPIGELGTFIVAIDRSASMLWHERSGALQSILEVILGLNTVCGSSRSIAVWAMGSRPDRIRPDISEATLDGYVQTVVGDQALTSGTALVPLVGAIPMLDPHQTVFVITDDAPPDLDAAIDALRARPDATQWHLVVLARDQTDPSVRNEMWRDELRSLARPVQEGLLTVSAIAPGDDPGWLAGRLSEPDYLDVVVNSLGPWSTTSALSH